MMSAKTRLIVAAGLFAAWVGWLIYLVARTRDPVILSRPQFLLADVIVTAQLSGDDQPDSKVKIIDVLWADDEKKPAPGAEIDVIFLTECKTKNHGWEGSGLYLLALKKKEQHFFVQEIPSYPGFPPTEAETREKFPRFRIYRAGDDARRQADELVAAKKAS